MYIYIYIYKSRQWPPHYLQSVQIISLYLSIFRNFEDIFSHKVNDFGLCRRVVDSPSVTRDHLVVRWMVPHDVQDGASFHPLSNSRHFSFQYLWIVLVSVLEFRNNYLKDIFLYMCVRTVGCTSSWLHKFPRTYIGGDFPSNFCAWDFK